MKKLLIAIVSLCLVFWFSGCAQSETQNDDGRLNVVVTIFPSYDFVREIAGDRVNLTMLLQPGMEMHTFDPSFAHIESIRNSSVFIYVGGHSDEWVTSRVLEDENVNPRTVIALMDQVQLIKGDDEHSHDHDHSHDHGHGHDDDCDDDDCDDESHDHSHDHDDDHGHEHNHSHDHGHNHDHDHSHGDEYDEHVWTSPVNAKLIVQAISDALIEADPDNAYYYRENTERFLAELTELDAQFREVVENGVRDTIIVGDRFPFRYFVDEYGINYYAAFTGCSTKIDPGIATIIQLREKIEEYNIPVVFYIEMSNQEVANTLIEDTDAKLLLLHSVHNVSRDDFQAGYGYLDFMRQNVINLREALS